MTDEFEGRVITNPDANSRAAAASVQPHAANARRRIFSLIQEHPEGLACWEVEQITAGLHQSVSATINWLHNHGYLARRGKNRAPSGRAAYIYVATTAAERRVRPTEPERKPLPLVLDRDVTYAEHVAQIERQKAAVATPAPKVQSPYRCHKCGQPVATTDTGFGMAQGRCGACKDKKPQSWPTVAAPSS